MYIIDTDTCQPHQDLTPGQDVKIDGVVYCVDRVNTNVPTGKPYYTLEKYGKRVKFIKGLWSVHNWNGRWALKRLF